MVCEIEADRMSLRGQEIGASLPLCRESARHTTSGGLQLMRSGNATTLSALICIYIVEGPTSPKKPRLSLYTAILMSQTTLG